MKGYEPSKLNSGHSVHLLFYIFLTQFILWSFASNVTDSMPGSKTAKIIIWPFVLKGYLSGSKQVTAMQHGDQGKP